ncbi:hypothetical protein [Halomonas garicola]|uniref:hypothetical protein n=1 Tax=Halomonas garicola TaxID=1690008 RepID=UPI00289F9B56|nr:hypothetical protein [Halomonas garicola]
MSRLVIHIGMPKTGSSSIQDTLFAKGRHVDFRYADLGVANQGGKLRSYFSTDPYEWPGHRAAGRAPDQVKAFNEAVGREVSAIKAQGGQQVISGEDLYHLGEEGLRRLRDEFSRAFDRVEIIGYIRPPASFIASAFVQLVKNHGQSRLDLNKLWPRYRAKLEKFDQIFGREHVTLRPFDHKKLADGDVVQDFFQFLGAPIDPTEIRRVNESLSLEATAALFFFRQEGPCYQPYPGKASDNNRLVNMLAGFGERKLRFADSLVRPILEREAADLEWIESRLGQPLQDAGSTDDDAITCEQDLLDVAKESRQALEVFVREQAHTVEPTPQQIANWMEKLRVTVTGRASNGVTPAPCSESSFFTREQVQRLTGQKMGPAAALRELAVAFERNGHREQACLCAEAASALRPDVAGLRALSARLCGGPEG